MLEFIPDTSMSATPALNASDLLGIVIILFAIVTATGSFIFG